MHLGAHRRRARRSRLAAAILASTLALGCGTPDADVLVTIDEGVFGQLSSSSDVFPPEPRRYYEGRAVGVANEDGEWRNTLTDVNGFFEISAPPGKYILCEASSVGSLRRLDQDVIWPGGEEDPVVEDGSGSGVEVEGCYRNFLTLGFRRCDHRGAPPLWMCE